MLAIAETPEKYDYIRSALADIIDEVSRLEYVELDDHRVTITFIICADLKFTNEIMGLGACSSLYSCAWCKSPSSDFSCVNDDHELRTIA